MLIFGREPAAVAGLVKAVIALLVAFGLGWTTEQVSLVNAAAAAVLAVVVAFQTRDRLASAVIGLTDAALALGVGFGLGLTPEQTGAVIALVTVALGLFLRTQTSPQPIGRHVASSDGGWLAVNAAAVVLGVLVVLVVVGSLVSEVLLR